MSPKSAKRFSDKLMREGTSMSPKKPAPDLIRGAKRFSDKLMREGSTIEVMLSGRLSGTVLPWA
jgi:hypothetical protein